MPYLSQVNELMTLINSGGDQNVSKIKIQYQKAHNEVNETHQFFCSLLDDRKQELHKELEGLYNAKIQSNAAWLQRSKELVDKTMHSCDATERNSNSKQQVQANLAESLMLRKALDLQLQAALQEQQQNFDLEFMSNYQSIQAGVRNTFGYIRASSPADVVAAGMGGGGGAASAMCQKQPPIARPSQQLANGGGVGGNNCTTVALNQHHLPSGLGLVSNLLDSSYSNAASNALQRSNAFEDLLPKRFQSSPSSQNSAANAFNGMSTALNPYEKWSNGGSDNLFSSLTQDPFSNAPILSSLSSAAVNGGSSALPSLCSVGGNGNCGSAGSVSSDSLLDLTSMLLSASIYPPKSQIKRQKMIYHCGSVSLALWRDSLPSRAVLLYPNRVSVVRNSGDIIVTERSPTHQIQIYNQYGQFVRKFGANILQHPCGVTVDNKGRIFVVECKVMRVIIFDQNGNVLHKFGCSKHLEFPNGVVVNDKQEIFISDNRAHCVKVFNYEGQYLRQIGGEGITNYPIGVGININGEILIADNHNNFNLTIFTQDGQLVSALESKVKHAQCFDVALMDDGSVVLASKDYRLYIYRYVQVPPIGL